MTGARIVISYRRSDAAGYAGRLDDDLSDHFGEDQVFRDVSQIVPGTAFLAEIDRAISAAAAVLVVIGPDWAAGSHPGGPRLLEPTDVVRYEVTQALRLRRPVVPVLVGGAGMPRPHELPPDLAELRSLHAVELSDTRWPDDVARLLTALGSLGILPETAAFPEIPPDSRCESRAAWFARGDGARVRALLTSASAGVGMRTEPWTGDITRVRGGSALLTRTLGALWVPARKLPSVGFVRVRDGSMSRVEVLLREDWGPGLFTGLSDKYGTWFTACLAELRRSTTSG